MKKLFTFAIALFAGMAMMADPVFKSNFSDLTGTDDGEFYTYLKSSDYADFLTAGWMSYTGASTGSTTLKIDPATDETISGSSATYGKVKKNGNRYMEFYVTGITAIKFYFHNAGSDDRRIQYILNGGTATDLVTVVNKTSDVGTIALDAATENTIRIFSPDNDVYVCALKVTPEGAAPSTDPKLSATPEKVTLAVTAAQPQASASVTFTGKNLTAGNYALTLPNVAGLTVAPSSVTVGEDGKLNAEITLSYTSDVDVAADSAAISLTIGELTKTVKVNYSAIITKQYLNQSLNIEQLVLDNGIGYNIKAAFDAAHIEYNNIDALDTLNDLENKTARNYAFLGLKMKKADAALRCWLQAGHTISVRFGNVGASFLVRANGMQDTLTNAMANTTVDSDTALTFTAPMDMYLEIICNSTKTLVIKQIMLDAPIEAVTLPAPNAYMITIAESEHGTVTATWDNKKYRTPVGATVTLNFEIEEGYIVHNCYVNGEALHGQPNEPITFIMPAEDVTVVTDFDLPTALDNTEATVKAVKVIRNGQLLIEKNGTLYNAQGAEIK